MKYRNWASTEHGWDRMNKVNVVTTTTRLLKLATWPDSLTYEGAVWTRDKSFDDLRFQLYRDADWRLLVVENVG